MSRLRQTEILGGGLAGLSLGLTLARRGLPVRIIEAGNYPRHRVCGEFIAGLDDETGEELGLDEFLGDALQHRHVTWHCRGRLLGDLELARPALALSRHTLDARLAAAFQKAGGQLIVGQRADPARRADGLVHGIGRRRGPPCWLGLKLHVTGLALDSDLEVHLGHRAYVGLCRVENDAVNVCGFFRIRDNVTTTRRTALLDYLRGCGLSRLAERVEASHVDDASSCAVAGVSFSRAPAEPDQLPIGDAFAMIPPFTGNGMAMAFQSARCVLPHVMQWAQNELTWAEAVGRSRRALGRRFNRRLALAHALHPFLLAPGPQLLFNVFNRTRLLPLQSLAGAVHA